MTTPTKPSAAKRGAHRRSSPIRPFIIPLIVLLIGLLVLAYPVVATQWNNYQTMQEAKMVGRVLEKISPEERDHEIAAARAYNAALTGGVAYDPWTKAPDESTPAYKDYERQLALTDAMGELLIPVINVDLPIFHGTSDATLDKGVGHLYGTSLPIGGQGTHAVLTAHTGFNDKTLFDNLIDVKKGDTFFVKTVAGTLKYEVDQIKVVLPTDTSALQRDDTHDYVTLITCTPYGINSHRLLVRGHRVPFNEAKEGVPASSQLGGLVWQWWMIAILAAIGAIIVALFALALWGRFRAQRKFERFLQADTEA